MSPANILKLPKRFEILNLIKEQNKHVEKSNNVFDDSTAQL